MIHENDLYAPFAFLPDAFQTNISWDKRLPSRIASYPEERSPELRDLPHQRQVDPIGSDAVLGHGEGGFEISFVVSIFDIRGDVAAQHFFQEFNGKLPLVDPGELDPQPFLEVFRGAARREI